MGGTARNSGADKAIRRPQVYLWRYVSLDFPRRRKRHNPRHRYRMNRKGRAGKRPPVNSVKDGCEWIVVASSRRLALREKRRRAAAVQDADAIFCNSRLARSVLECASPLAHSEWNGRVWIYHDGAVGRRCNPVGAGNYFGWACLAEVKRRRVTQGRLLMAGPARTSQPWAER
jgi:hypothetical protein